MFRGFQHSAANTTSNRENLLETEWQLWTYSFEQQTTDFTSLKYSAVKLAQFYKTRAFWTIPVKIINTFFFFFKFSSQVEAEFNKV